MYVCRFLELEIAIIMERTLPCQIPLQLVFLEAWNGTQALAAIDALRQALDAQLGLGRCR